MKALLVKEPNQLAIVERPKPSIVASTDVLVKVKAGGICGSDVHIYHGCSSVATYPRVIGHEIAGIVESIGNEVLGLEIGDHVVLDPVMNCGQCYQCRIGRGNVCSKLQVRSVHIDGGYQEWIVVPVTSLYKIPKHISWETAVMIEPFTVAKQVCSRAEMTSDDRVFIMGAGPLGLSVLKMAKLIGATCYVSDIMDNKLAFAKQYGADALINATQSNVKDKILELTQGDGATVVIDAACTNKSLEQALECVCAAGRVIALGFSNQPTGISQLSITAREIDIRGSRLHNNKFPEVIADVVAGKLEISSMITHRFNFMEIHEALALIEDPKIEKGKIVLLF